MAAGRRAQAVVVGVLHIVAAVDDRHVGAPAPGAAIARIDPATNTVVATMSGGNQQKVVIAKWLATRPRILIMDEPTRGIDVNAKNEIYKLIRRMASNGLGLIVVSSELPEILTLCDRVLVLAEGTITAEIEVKENTSEDQILKAAIPNLAKPE